MIHLRDLPQITDKTLHGLTADDTIKHRIIQKVTESGRPEPQKRFRPVPVLCGLIAAALIAAIALNGINPVQPVSPGEMNVFAAGSKDSDSTVAIPESGFLPELEPDAVVSIEITGLGKCTDPSACASLISTLKDEAVLYESNAALSGAAQLQITLRDGSPMIFYADEPCLFGDQCYLCPTFFECFREALDR